MFYAIQKYVNNFYPEKIIVMWNLTNFSLFLYIIGLSKFYINIANAMDVTKKLCDELKADAAVATAQASNHQRENNFPLPMTHDDCKFMIEHNHLQNHPPLSDDENDYVIEDVGMQNDQPADRHFRTPYSYGSVRRQPSQQQLMHHQQQQQQQFHNRREELNIVYTKEVLIKQGLLKGMVRLMHDQSGLKNVDQYLGIPYAAAPVGNGRFMPPGAPPPWHGIKLAINLSPVCPQNLPSLNNSNNLISAGRYDQLKRLLPFLRDESEDCLFLNLYVPKWENIGPHQKYPVIIYIHGESYEWNSGNPYDGSVLASYGQVIVVTLNYRLGILGFLKPGTNDHTVSNFGLLDQIAALQWVKDNIGAFGGDNKAVTLMGHGTGAACVNLLMVSPVARGLFHRAILMSGSALSDWALANHPLQSTMQVVQGLNCPLRDDHEEMLICLRKKRYQEILKTRISTPEFSTTFGPVVDNLVVPNQPHKVMGQYNGVFSRYDMLFGLTEIESYHNLNAIGLSHGLLESERDSYLRFYMQNRFEIRPDIAMALTLQEYTDIYNNPERPLAEEHRDTVLEVLSDARVASPLIQTGLYHAKVNPRSYMYVFAHNSKAGEFSNLPQSIVGEDLPYIFGAPLASAGPFQSRYSPEERLLSEAMMVYWTNFVKTGNPKAPWREQFLNLEPKDWETYDIDWPEFNAVNLNYLNIGIPPVVNQKYKWKYMNFWNQYLPEELNRTINMKPMKPYPELYAPNPTPYPIRSGTAIHQQGTGSGGGGAARINYYPDKTTEDPFRALKFLLNHPNLNHSDIYNTQATVVTTIADETAPIPPPIENIVNAENEVIVKADATLNILIGIVILFLLVNVIILVVYFLRRHYFNKTLKRKLDVLTLDGTTDDDVKRSKTNDGDESFSLDMRKKNEYEPIRRNRSPINGFLLSRELSTSTVDAHTKVCDWMSKEILKQSPKNKKKFTSPRFSLRTKSFFRKPSKVSVAIDATPQARSASILRQEPVELMKPQLYEFDNKDLIICQEIDVDASFIDSVNFRETGDRTRRNSHGSLKGCADVLRIDHRHSRSDPVPMYYRKAAQPDEDITVFIEDVDINVTSRDDTVERDLLSPEEALKTFQMRNYPKVLPNYPDDTSEYVSSSVKRRSLPPQSFFNSLSFKTPPAPPPRTTSTLGRRPSGRRDSKNITTSPLMMAEEPPIEVEPEITCNVLHVGPLIPNSNESIYSTAKKQTATGSTASGDKTFSCENTITMENYVPLQQDNSVCVPTSSTTEAQIVNVEQQQTRPSGIKPPTGYKPGNLSKDCSSSRLGPQEKRIGGSVGGPKVIIKPTSINRQNSTEKKSNIPRVQAPQDVATTCSSNNNSTNAQQTLPGSRIPIVGANNNSDRDRSASTSDSSSSSSTATTVKQKY